MNPINSFTHESGVSYSMWYSPDKLGRMFAEGKIYERPFLDWIREQDFTGTALDVGGNIGTHSLWMHFVCGLDVIAFEPVIPHVTRANAHLNGVLDRGIRVFDYALGDVPGLAHHKGKGVICSGKSAQSTDELFEIRRLDDQAIGYGDGISFMKLDCEGYEPNVLQGARVTIQYFKPVIATEEWGPAASKAVGAVLRPMGYRPSETFGGRGKAPMTAWRCDQ